VGPISPAAIIAAGVISPEGGSRGLLPCAEQIERHLATVNSLGRHRWLRRLPPLPPPGPLASALGRLLRCKKPPAQSARNMVFDRAVGLGGASQALDPAVDPSRLRQVKSGLGDGVPRDRQLQAPPSSGPDGDGAPPNCPRGLMAPTARDGGRNASCLPPARPCVRWR
jgi:hypothetical protein